MSGLTKSAQAERERILKLHNAAAVETCKLILVSGMPGPTAHERQKLRWKIEGVKWAVDALRKAIKGETITPLPSEKQHERARD